MSATACARWLGHDPAPPPGIRRGTRAWLACITDGPALLWHGGTHKHHTAALAEAEAELARRNAPKGQEERA